MTRVDQSTNQALARIRAVSAIVGAVLLLVSTLLHPMESDPNDPVAAFAEYAADSFWIWSHLGQFLGFACLAVALVALASTFEPGRPAAWGRIGLAGTIVVVTIAAMLQAIDGVALKTMVDHWASATGETQAATFEAAFAVRQVEVGIASYLSIVSGLTLLIFSLAVILSTRYPTWLGGFGFLAGLGVVTGGAAQAAMGFSDLPMTLSMTSSTALLTWVVLAGMFMWRLAPQLESRPIPVGQSGRQDCRPLRHQND